MTGRLEQSPPATEPLVALSDEARLRIRGSLHGADPPRRHLRIRVTSQGGRFQYRLRALTEEEILDEDLTVAEEGFVLVVDPESAARLRGARIDYRQSLLESGFRFDNPNAPQSPTLQEGARPDLQGPIPDRVQTLLDSEINPAIAAHGGHVRLVDVRDDRVYLAFGGGCHGCGMVDVTLKQGIDRRIREVVPEVIEVVDTTDHSAGENPYY